MIQPSLLPYFLLLCLWSLYACEPQPTHPKEAPQLQWTLIDSLVLESSSADTIFDGWPYYGNGDFYLLSFYDFKARRYDTEGNLHAIIGKGMGKGPGEVLMLQAMNTVGSQVGLFDNLSQSLALYDTSGHVLRPIKFEKSVPSTGETYSLNADNRVFNYYQGKFYNLVQYIKANHYEPKLYEYPFIAIHDQKGNLLNVFGERAPIFQEKLMPQQHKVHISIDSFAHRILVSQPASHTWETYDLEGNLLAHYGEPGAYIADQTWEGIDFEGKPQNTAQNKQVVDLIFQSPKYHHLVALPTGHVIRSYRRGVEDYEGMMNFLDKPHFLQVYDADGNLISDAPAPDFYFIPVAVVEGDLWVNLARSYDPHAYTYTLYRYRLELAR